MNAGKWFVLKREHDPAGLPYSWPDATRRMWKERVKERAGRGIRKTFEFMREGFRQIDPSPAIFILFPREYAMSGHLASIRKVWENLQLINFECWRTGTRMGTPGRYFGTDAVVVWTKYVVHKLAELSPLFAPVWEDLKDSGSGQCGIYLADAPDPAWLESIRSGEERLYAEFQNGRHLDMIGLEMAKPPNEEISRDRRRALDLIVEEKYEEGDALLRELIVRWPAGAWMSYWDLARSAMWQGNLKQALAIVWKVQREYPDCLNFDRLAVDCALDLKDWPRAEYHLERLKGMNPWDPNLLLRYAKLAYGRSDFPQAVRMFEECSESGELNYPAQTEYGLALAKTGRMKDSLDLFETLRKERPEDPVLLNNVGFLLASAGRTEEGLKYCRQALELEPDREFFWDSVGFVQLKSGNYREATRSFLKAVELNPSFPDAWRHLLHAYHKEGKTDRLEGAKSYVSRVLPDQLARFEREKGAEILD